MGAEKCINSESLCLSQNPRRLSHGPRGDARRVAVGPASIWSTLARRVSPSPTCVAGARHLFRNTAGRFAQARRVRSYRAIEERVSKGLSNYLIPLTIL